MSMTHTDFAGRQLAVGDTVAAATPSVAHLRAYRIVAFTENGFHGEALTSAESTAPGRRTNVRRLLVSHQVSKMEGN